MPVSKARDIAFSVLLVVFLLGPITLWIVQTKLHLNLSSWLTAEDVMCLTGDWDSADIKPNLSFEEFTNKSLQKDVEQFVYNYTPLRAGALLLNSKLQRKAIEISNTLFMWDTYPTYYESTRLHNPTYSTIRGYLDLDPTEIEQDVKTFGERLAQFASSNPDIDICVSAPNCGSSLPIEPSWKYRTTRVDESICIELCSIQAQGIDNLHIAYKPVESYADYLDYYYLCDDHWNGFGALALYNLVAVELELPTFESPPEETDALSEYCFYGYNGRKGLMLIESKGKLREPSLDVEGLQVSDSISNAKILSKNELPSPQSFCVAYNFYGWFYGTDASSTIINTNSTNDESVLIICDSFGDAFRWAAAEKCKEVYSFYDLYSLDTSDSKLINHIKETGARKVVFLGRLQAMLLS